MLKWMHLENLALVEKADMEFGSGFNVISGETGAGKSVIMGGVALLLGDRADKSMIRIGAARCEISGEFQLSGLSLERVGRVLEEAGIPPGENDSLLVRRVITASAGRNFINESPVALQTLRRIGEMLVDTHAAHDDQHLLKTRNQLEMLDRFAKLEPRLSAVRGIWDALSDLRRERDAFASTMPSAEETARFRRDASEIEKADPKPDEDAELEARHAVAAHAKNIIELASGAANGLTECEDSIADRLGLIRRSLSDMEKYDPEHAGRFLETLEEISSLVSELSSELNSHASEVDVDEGAFRSMEERLRVLQTLKRRYGPSLEDVLTHLDSIRARIDAYDNAEQHRIEFAGKEKSLLEQLRAECVKLSAARRKAAETVSSKTAAELRKLGFKKAEFSVAFSETEPGPEGADGIEFLFSANPGVPVMPLREVASSGELSRVMLALKTVLAEADAVPILIFDEIDANIGGETASKVGDEIASLARAKQILCISHLPQIASRATVHFSVFKESRGNVTNTYLRKLDVSGRGEEIARMLGGGRDALALAEKMLKPLYSKDL